ncbi:CaiB/BaiF CoA transferase family protein [Ornithinimicrobium cavernae]|uniref:CaiB/BaiF CoA transferase family protein n=1 Tax=Ornithinimicrobium cavernae TaxID=2666047 RepID=UPI0013798579|nr:CaiB/BaiF CoA-transferase family protein [Ornithinimicrobium cavernae]
MEKSPHGRAPLCGVKVVEFSGIGPIQFAGMALADLGADIIRIDRPPTDGHVPPVQAMDRGRRSIAVDLKHPDGVRLALDLIRQADVVMEGYRPGTMQRLGLSPEICWESNARLVYASITGWGQTGPESSKAGHDINFIAAAGVLDAIGRDEPTVPLNLLGDYAGGGLTTALGVVAALYRARETGQGEFIDAAMLDGIGYLATQQHDESSRGQWREERATNLLDGGYPLYNVYECADGQWLAVGAIEEKFALPLLGLLGMTHLAPTLQRQAEWTEACQDLAELFRQRSRADWMTLLGDADVCVTPVLSLAEVPTSAHSLHRKLFGKVGQAVAPEAAPRFRFAARPQVQPAPFVGENTREILAELSYDTHTVNDYTERGFLFTHPQEALGEKESQ